MRVLVPASGGSVVCRPCAHYGEIISHEPEALDRGAAWSIICAVSKLSLMAADDVFPIASGWPSAGRGRGRRRTVYAQSAIPSLADDPSRALMATVRPEKDASDSNAPRGIVIASERNQPNVLRGRRRWLAPGDGRRDCGCV